jgi:hypothetical protein
MKTQTNFVSSRSRDAGSPSEIFLTFHNGLIKEYFQKAIESLNFIDVWFFMAVYLQRLVVKFPRDLFVSLSAL